MELEYELHQLREKQAQNNNSNNPSQTQQYPPMPNVYQQQWKQQAPQYDGQMRPPK